MKIIIIGCGKIGQQLTIQLSREDNEVVIVDTKRTQVEKLCSHCDVLGVVGNGASLNTLREAGVEDADVVIAVTNSDELNLLCCLLAKKAGNCQTIARVRSPEYNEEISLIKEELGLAMVINPERAAAHEMSMVLHFPSAIKIETFAKGRIEILKFRVPQGSVIANMSISQIISSLKCNILVCAIERGSQITIPLGDFVIEEGDIVSITTTPQTAVDFFKKIKIKTNQVKDAMIIGGGAISYYLAQSLIKSGISVKIIETNLERCNFLDERLPSATIIHGDAGDSELLMEEGLEATDAFVALTNLDEENIMLSLHTKSCSNAKRITKINRISFNDVIDSLDLDTVIQPKNITTDYIVQFVRAMKNSIGSNVQSMCHIIEGKAEALEFIIKSNSAITGKPLQDLKLSKNTLIAAISRNGKMIIPRGQDTIEVGDSVIVVTTKSCINDITDILV